MKPLVCSAFYRAAGVSLGVIAALLAVLVWIVFAAAASREKALLLIASMIVALFFGWVLASLYSPLNPTEEGQFKRALGTLGAVISGFTLAKFSDVITSLGVSFRGAAPRLVEIGFFVMVPLASFLAGIISAAILRSVIVTYWENRHQVQRRELYEKISSVGPSAAAGAAADDAGHVTGAPAG